MSTDDHVGFWSYAHRDNDLDRGRVARLADDIADEFELQTGRTLRMFIDRHSIEWGDEWSRAISAALNHTVFFIAIVTPSYLQSAECRKEFLYFASLLRSGKPGAVLLPILYSEVSNVTGSENRHQIMRIVQRTQYEDWRTLRLSEHDSAEYRRAIHRMVTRIIAILQHERS